MTFEEWALRLGFTREAVEACLALPDEEALAAFEKLKVETKRRYRAFARSLHPDLGGDGEALKSLNHAWSMIDDICLVPVVDPLADTKPEAVPMIVEDTVAVLRITIIGNWIKIS